MKRKQVARTILMLLALFRCAFCLGDPCTRFLSALFPTPIVLLEGAETVNASPGAQHYRTRVRDVVQVVSDANPEINPGVLDSILGWAFENTVHGNTTRSREGFWTLEYSVISEGTELVVLVLNPSQSPLPMTLTGRIFRGETTVFVPNSERDRGRGLHGLGVPGITGPLRYLCSRSPCDTNNGPWVRWAEMNLDSVRFVLFELHIPFVPKH